MSETINPLPRQLFESLLAKLADILELSQDRQALLSVEGRQALLKATNEFKSSLSRAKELATDLPGGDMTLEEQDEVIEMLEQLKGKKLQQLANFASHPLNSTRLSDHQMDIDSNASTPQGN